MADLPTQDFYNKRTNSIEKRCVITCTITEQDWINIINTSTLENLENLMQTQLDYENYKVCDLINKRLIECQTKSI